MANWDVFHGDRLELERGLTTSAIREALARGDLRDDDLVRPAGTTVAWARLADLPELAEPAAASPQPRIDMPAPAGNASPTANVPVSAAAPSTFELQAEEPGPSSALLHPQEPTRRAPDWVELRSEPDDVSFPVIKDEPAERNQTPSSSKMPGVAPAGAWEWARDDDEDDIEESDADFESNVEVVEDLGANELEILEDETDAHADVPFAHVVEPSEKSDHSRVALPVVTSDGSDAAGALAEIPEEEEFSLSRSGPMTVEELDLAPMVDVAFQLVLFFMVAAQTVLYKTLEIPKPSAEQAPAAVAQGRSRTLDELKEDYILLEIDGSGAMKIDRQPVASDSTTLIERLRSAREATHRKAMLLSAEYGTAHRNAVLAYDAANEIGLGIVIARPASPQGPAPGLGPARPAPPAPGQAAATAVSAPN